MPGNNSRELMMINHHRGCKGKAHGSGIGKQQNNGHKIKINNNNSSRTIQTELTTTDDDNNKKKIIKKSNIIVMRKDNDNNDDRKLSRNSTSSWDYSDSDSLNSSEFGQILSPDPSSMIKRIDLVLNDCDKRKSSLSSRSSIVTSELSSRKRYLKRGTWAESLRSASIVDDKYRKLEEGWDDNNIIKHPRERKWHITTDSSYRNDPYENNNNNISNKRYYHHHYRKSNNGRINKRNHHNNNHHPNNKTNNHINYDIIEWDVILEMAMAKKKSKKVIEKFISQGFGFIVKDKNS